MSEAKRRTIADAAADTSAHTYEITRITKERGREVIRSGTCAGYPAFRNVIAPTIEMCVGEFKCYASACERNCMIKHEKIGLKVDHGVATKHVFMRFYPSCGLAACGAVIDKFEMSKPGTLDVTGGITTNCCFHCHKKEEVHGKVALKRCARCTRVTYCSRDCQIADWPHHKHECHAPQPVAAATAATGSSSLVAEAKT